MFFKNDSGDGRRAVRVLPLLPLRDIIVFPHMVVPLFVGRERSIASLEEAMATGKELLLSAQKMAKTNDPRPDEIFPLGTIGSIIQLLRLPDGTVKVLIEGKRRGRIRKFVETQDLFRVEVESLADCIRRDAVAVPQFGDGAFALVEARDGLGDGTAAVEVAEFTGGRTPFHGVTVRPGTGGAHPCAHGDRPILFGFPLSTTETRTSSR
jgi:hypothetical protein